MGDLEKKKSYSTDLRKIEEFPVGFPASYQQPEEEAHLRDYLGVIMRRKWTAIAFFIVVASAIILWTFLTTPIYRSTVTIKIDKENPYVLKFKDVYEIERVEEDYYQTQYKILKSRNLARKVIKSAKLYQNPHFVNADDLSKKAPGSTVNGNNSTSEGDAPQGVVVDAFLSMLTIEPLQKSRLVRVNFDSHSPQLSTDIANEIAKAYMEFSIESKFEATQQAREWLEKQLQDMKARVEKSEEELNRYAAQKGIIFVSESWGSDARDIPRQDIATSNLSQMSNNFIQATSERIAKEALYRETQHGDLDSVMVVINNPLIQGLKKDNASAEAEYSQLSKVYKSDYPRMVRLKEQITQIKEKIESETRKIISGIKREYETALKRERYLQKTLEKYKAEVQSLNEKMVQYQILRRENETNRELYNGLLQRLKEVGVSASLTTTNIQVLDRAEIPKTPYKPKKTTNILLAIVVGLLGGLGLAFFVEYLDNTVKTLEDIEKDILLPSLGIVPDFSKKVEKGREVVEILSDRRSPFSEAYRSVGTYIQFSSAVKPPRTMLITSPRQGEGKTTTVVNTAIALSHSYGKGIVIDADMRRSRLHEIFAADNTAGLSSYLTGNAEISDGLIQKTKIENLDIITSGIMPPNPSELLSSPRMNALINELFSLYSFIIFDSPPVLGLSDSLVLSTLADGVIMVIRADDTPRDAAVKARKLLQGVNARILGVILNGISETELRNDYYSDYYSGGHKEDDGNNAARS
jgi:capsular exopolysaccharide synthesis family protein